jgi:diadenosine tetraphosphate (Ap4A) HIT family hydrolase
VSSVTAQSSATSAVVNDAFDDLAGDDPSTCVFCLILASSASDQERFVVKVGARTAVLLNAYPYASGHLLIMPIRHVATIDDLDDEESNELWSMTRNALRAIEIAYGPDGVNLGANLGRAAGAGIPRHVHLHVLPRWLGDTNFMTTVASVRVMPEALSESWRKLREAWPA